jgi:ferrous iron transport protein A
MNFLKFFSMFLHELKKQALAVVESVTVAGDQLLANRLQHIGFIEGEPIQVLGHGPGGIEPLSVQIGDTVFALRLEEARHVKVRLVEIEKK